MRLSVLLLSLCMFPHTDKILLQLGPDERLALPLKTVLTLHSQTAEQKTKQRKQNKI